VWRARIDAYGTTRVDIGQGLHQPLRWPGHYWDTETGLHDNRFRTYSPELGRYLQSDPIGIEGGLNLYAYTNNPLNAVDLRGHNQDCPDGPNCPQRKKKESEDGADSEGTPPAPHPAEGEAPASPEYPPRTPEARAEAQHVVDTMSAMGLSSEKRKAVSVLTHEDGTVSVGISGKDTPKNREVADRVAAKLNEGCDPPKYRVAPNGNEGPSGIKQQPGGNKSGDCAEPSAAAAAHGHDSPVTGMDTRWRGDGENPHPFTGSNSDGAPAHPSQMDPCPTCAHPDNIAATMEHANG
jgi:RHS repeat-associated protein